MPLDFAKLVGLAEEEAYEPVSEKDIAEAERRLGFPLPALVRKIYSEAGDCGFGPGHGFYGLLDGTDEFPDESVVDLYLAFSRTDPDDPAWLWPKKLLPLVDWGCAIRSCVDCSTDGLNVIRFDPNLEGCDMLRPEGKSFEDWLSAWLAGEDLW